MLPEDVEATQVINRVYDRLKEDGLITRSVDAIAYTEDFNRLYLRVSQYLPLTKNEVFTRLMNIRKRGKAQAPKRKNK